MKATIYMYYSGFPWPEKIRVECKSPQKLATLDEMCKLLTKGELCYCKWWFQKCTASSIPAILPVHIMNGLYS